MHAHATHMHTGTRSHTTHMHKGTHVQTQTTGTHVCTQSTCINAHTCTHIHTGTHVHTHSCTQAHVHTRARHTHRYTCAHRCTQAHVHTQAYTCVHTYTKACTQGTCIQAHRHAHVQACTQALACVQAHVHTHMHMHKAHTRVHTHPHTHTHSLPLPAAPCRGLGGQYLFRWKASGGRRQGPGLGLASLCYWDALQRARKELTLGKQVLAGLEAQASVHSLCWAETTARCQGADSRCLPRPPGLTRLPLLLPADENVQHPGANLESSRAGPGCVFTFFSPVK